MQTKNAIAAASDLIRRDTGIPGLELILDPARLLTDLDGALDCTRVNDIKLVYLRYKPGMNCLARYRVQTDEYIIHAHAKAFGQDANNKLKKSLQRPVVDGVLGPGRVALGERQIVFSTFPNDAKLASLQRLGSKNLQQRLFQRIFGPQSGWRDSTPGPALNYKPERRYVTRLTQTDSESALLKFYSVRGFDQARTLNRKLRDNREGFYPETIGKSRKHAAIAYRWQPGVTLRQQHIDGNLSMDTLAAAACSLADLHRSAQQGLSPARPDEQAQKLHELAVQTGYLLPILQQRSMRVALQLTDWLTAQVPVTQPVHGDFYDKQVIVDQGKTALIDLDTIHLDNPLLDLGNYIAHLEKQSIDQSITPNDLSTHRDSLLQAYEQSAGSICPDQLKHYIALGLFSLIHQPFRDWTANWPTQTEQLLARVEALITA